MIRRFRCLFSVSCRRVTEARGFHSRSQVISSLPPLGDQLFGLQLHLCSPFEGHVHQELEATEVLCEVWWGRGRGVEQPAAGAQVALHAGAAEDGGSGGKRVALIPAPEQRLRLHGLQQLGRPVAVHPWVGGRRARLHRRGDGGVTDDGRTVWNEARGGRRRRRGLPQDAVHGGVEAGGVQGALVAALLRPRRGAAVLRGLGAVGEAVPALTPFPGDGELVGVLAVLSQHLGEESSPSVDEPVAHLETNGNEKHAVRKRRRSARLCFASKIPKTRRQTICWFYLGNNNLYNKKG